MARWASAILCSGRKWERIGIDRKILLNKIKVWKHLAQSWQKIRSSKQKNCIDSWFLCFCLLRLKIWRERRSHKSAELYDYVGEFLSDIVVEDSTLTANTLPKMTFKSLWLSSKQIFVKLWIFDNIYKHNLKIISVFRANNQRF